MRSLNRIIWLGVLCSVFIAVMGMIARDVYHPNISLYKLVKYGLAVSMLLLIIWFVNLWFYFFFKNKKPVSTVVKVAVISLTDFGLIGLFIVLKRYGLFASFQDYFLLDMQVFVRFFLAVLWTTSVQFTFINAIQKEVLIQHNEQLRNENLVAELEGLRQQINPHFLFNSLGTLRVMVRDKDENAEEYILRLAAVYRQFLSKRNDSTTTLQEELGFLENYLFMLKFRYEAGLNLLIDLDATNQFKHLPTGCLQLLMENCIKHNVVSTSKPLSVRLYQESPASITVENNKQPRQTQEESTGIGLDNLRKRYALLGRSDAVTIRETDHLFAVSIALIN
ncbi:sensor histidine kinase [Larkinella rosea]|uniref:Histidine kinase n=1 Tax=Larkinella rosea TaxID=2025312 RepID=A0A3P1C1V0_9BACT|nr:histidine kinase [Larkinella rosea]RRB07355.1 histidine kinase [Larkinella rosea]